MGTAKPEAYLRAQGYDDSTIEKMLGRRRPTLYARGSSLRARKPATERHNLSGSETRTLLRIYGH